MAPVQQSLSNLSAGRFWPLAIILATFALRVGFLDSKGLSYDEAASAMMARASIVEIVRFHWHAAFEHLPGWVILLRAWSLFVGQSEFALRVLPAFGSILSVPLVWHLLARFRPTEKYLRITASALIGLAPVLQLYGQEARMYALVVTLALGITLAWFAMIRKPAWSSLVTFVGLTWLMLSLQYYSLLLLPSLALCTLYILLRTQWRSWRAVALQTLAIGLSLLPLALWMRFSPGFAQTLEIVLDSAADTNISTASFLHETLLDLTFGAVRWTPAFAYVGFLLFIPVMVAIARAGRLRRQVSPATIEQIFDQLLFGLLALLCLTPVIATSLLFTTASTRYILFVAPFMMILVAAGIYETWRRNLLIGMVMATVVTLTCAIGLTYYFSAYQKSEYRNMAKFLTDRLDITQDSVMLEAPRQHLLAKYYLPSETQLIPIPAITLPDYWPITAPLVVPHEADDVIQTSLSTHATIWTIYAGENEVDPGEFLSKYLTAVSYQEDCNQWLDVRLCRYISPAYVGGMPVGIDPDVLFGEELRLRGATVTPFHSPDDAKIVSLLVKLDWIADKEPSRNYKITLRLMRDARIVAQTDSLPIGRLLPPTTWQSGDEKPGYMVLGLPKTLPSGIYTLEVGMYDPDTLKAIPYVIGSQHGDALMNLARIHFGDTIAVVSSAADATP